MHHRTTNRFLFVFIAFSLIAGSAFGATTLHKAKRKTTRATTAKAAKAAKHVVATTHHPVSHLSRLPKKRYVRNLWDSPTFADSTEGDSVDGEDLVVRRAAVEALGPYNGTVVVADPKTGRLLTIVNQKLAFPS